MMIQTPKLKAWLIGDPHMGRDFRNGVPLHRRGEREAMQRQQFIDELNTPDVDLVVMVGDLFDKPFVPLPVLSQVINDVLDAARARPDVTFVYMAGNHDRSRQVETQGAWDIFALAVSWVENIDIVESYAVLDDVAFFPWDWSITAFDQVDQLSTTPTPGISAFVGHWDMKDFGGDTSHMAPVAKLKALNPEARIYSGHYHEEKDYEVDGVTVHCTGSLQPYAHGEGEMYVTLTLEEALAREDLHDKCVRIILQPGEVLPEIDCLQLTKKMADRDVEEIDIGEIGIGGFDLHATLALEFQEHQVPDNVQTFIKEKLGAFA